MAPSDEIVTKQGLAQMLKGGVIMDVINPEQARIAASALAAAPPLRYVCAHTRSLFSQTGRAAALALLSERRCVPMPPMAIFTLPRWPDETRCRFLRTVTHWLSLRFATSHWAGRVRRRCSHGA